MLQCLTKLCKKILCCSSTFPNIWLGKGEEDFTHSIISCLSSSLKELTVSTRIAKPIATLGCDPAFHVSVSLHHYSPRYLQPCNSVLLQKGWLGLWAMKWHEPVFLHSFLGLSRHHWNSCQRLDRSHGLSGTFSDKLRTATWWNIWSREYKHLSSMPVQLHIKNYGKHWRVFNFIALAFGKR